MKAEVEVEFSCCFSQSVIKFSDVYPLIEDNLHWNRSVNYFPKFCYDMK